MKQPKNCHFMILVYEVINDSAPEFVFNDKPISVDIEYINETHPNGWHRVESYYRGDLVSTFLTSEKKNS